MSNKEEYREGKIWSDKFIPYIKPILGTFLIEEAEKEEDMLRNTDLTVLTLGAVRVGCRIRRHSAFKKYHDDITIRKSRPSGNESEITKIISGWGDYLFYGFSNYEENSLIAWRLIDLKAFRLWFNRELYNKRSPGFVKNNQDGSSDFYIFNCSKFPDGVVLRQYGFNYLGE